MTITELRGMTWDHPRALDSVVHSDGLLQERCGISVKWDARSLLAFGDQHISEFYADYDLMIIDHPHIPDAVHADAVIAFEDVATKEQLELLERTSVGQSHASYKYQGKHWALAIDTAAQVSAYRPDKADSAPVFWSDVFDLARTGKLLWAHKPVDAYSTFATLMAQKGVGLTPTKEFINEKVALEVLEFMVELAALVPEFCASSNPIDIAERLSGEETYSHGICMYGYSNYSHKGFRKHRLVYEDVPSFDGQASGSQLGGAGVAISSKSKNPQVAAAAAILLSSPEIQATTYGLAGGQPGNLVAWKNGALNDQTLNFFRNTLRTLERAWVRPRVLGWPDVQYQSSLIIHRALTSRQVNASVVSEIASTYEKYIKE
jgi:multiple sugar transport system substrate-binding protein